ncbi:P-loop containing nucleoside triphosphate hydrolase protein [Haematococcus lacustris]
MSVPLEGLSEPAATPRTTRSPAASAEPQASAPEASAPAPLDPTTEASHQAAIAALTARAQQHAAKMNDTTLTIEHMVLALADNPRFAEILQCSEGLSEEAMKAAIKKSRLIYNRGEVHQELVPEVQSALTKYAVDLTAAAKEGKLDPVVGRADEIRRVIHILCRRTKNNPVVLGEPGVGKTALVEGLAQRVAAGDVPEALRDVQVMALDMGLLMAGAFMPGEFEERLKGVLQELTENPAKRFVLFIDDLHNVTGPNAQQGGGVMDASVLLKPLLGRGELRCIGATSPDKYKKFIEKDPALERRFQQVVVEPPSVSDTISILRGLRAKLESHHTVRIADAALIAAVTLSDRYITDRYLPDKALDLVDEASARVRVEISLKPEMLDKLERRITAREAERRLLRRSAHASRTEALALEEVEAELSRLRAERAEMFEKYEEEKSESSELSSIQEEIDRLSDEIEALEDDGDAAAAVPLQQARREELVKKMRAIKAAAQAKHGVKKKAHIPMMSRGHVGEADIARVISSWTGIPLTKLVESELDRVLHLSDELHRRIVGQTEAVAAVAEAIQRSRAGMKDPNGPIASFLFLGPTGVGKTELAKALAMALFTSDDAMIRLDMSEFMEKHAVSKLIGAPPGYVGFDEGGQLTEKVRHKPYSVILFDEVEKAHVDVFNVLLQILDDGRVTDGQGRLVSFKNSIIIMTSNLGSAEIFREYSGKAAAGTRPGSGQAAGAPGPDKERIKELVMEQVRRHFRPEFVNRVDEFIIFEPLRAEQMAHIVGLRLKGVVGRLAEKRIRMALTSSALAYLATKGFDPVFGGRPVKRVIQRELETPLARAILRCDFAEGRQALALPLELLASGGGGKGTHMEGGVRRGESGGRIEGWAMEEDAVVVGVTAAVAGGGGAGQELTFTRVPGGGAPSGSAAVEAALEAQEQAAQGGGSGGQGQGLAQLSRVEEGVCEGGGPAAAAAAVAGGHERAVGEDASSNGGVGSTGGSAAGSSRGGAAAGEGSGGSTGAGPSPTSQGQVNSSSSGSGLGNSSQSKSEGDQKGGGKASGKAGGGGGASAAGPARMPGMGSRALKFDPLAKLSKAAASGDDLAADGAAAPADQDTLPTSVN